VTDEDGAMAVLSPEVEKGTGCESLTVPLLCALGKDSCCIEMLPMLESVPLALPPP